MKVYCIGELLIDFMPSQSGVGLKSVTHFEKAPGGAPANVAATVSLLGGESQFIGQVGKDAFGHYLVDVLKQAGVNTQTLLQTDKALTALAFVSLNETGEREFSFYRNPSADMLLQYDDLPKLTFNKDILHFCSVSLIDSPIKDTHIRLIEQIKKHEGIVSFDPNLRFSLWNDLNLLRNTVNAFIPLCDILKISDEELTFITQKTDINEAIASLFVGDVKVILYSQGKAGATVYLKEEQYDYPGYSVEVVDTTGAGDAFIGAVLYQIQQKGLPFNAFKEEDWKAILSFANAVGALVTTQKGAIPAIPSHAAIQKLMGQ